MFRAALDYIEDLMSQQVVKTRPLALLCLLSVASDGLGARELATARRHFLHAYGHQHLGLLRSLERLGLLAPRQVARPFSQACRRLDLLPRTVGGGSGDQQNPAYVFNGVYAPLVARLVEVLLRGSDPTELGVALGCPAGRDAPHDLRGCMRITFRNSNR